MANSLIPYTPTQNIGTITVKIFDYDTDKNRNFPVSYVRIGDVWFFFIYQNNLDYSGIVDLLEFRNFPVSILGGSVYFGGLSTNARDIGKGASIQGSAGKVYFRSNVVSTDFTNPTTSGITSGVLIGKNE